MIYYNNQIITTAFNDTKDYHTDDLNAVFKLHNKKDWAVRLGQNRNENGKIDWEYWVENEPMTVVAFLVIAENIGAFE